MRKLFLGFFALTFISLPAIAQLSDQYGPQPFSGFPFTLGSTVINSGTTTTSITALSILAGVGNTISVSGNLSSSANVVAGSSSAFSFTSRSALKTAADGILTFANAAGSNSVTISFPTATATPTFQFGAADAAAPVSQTLQAQSVVAGNANVAGATFTIAGSKSNGSGGGDVVFQTTLSSAASGTQNTLATALTLKGGTQNVITGASLTVTTIGTGTGDFVCAPIGGGLLSQGVTTCVASDRRVKNDLGVISPEQAVARVMALPDEHHFSYKAGYGPSGDHTGWWAQDIQKIWPGIVYRESPTKLTPDGELSLDRAEIGPDTTTAVKWLVGQVTILKAENRSLRAANDNFNRRLSTLEAHRKFVSLK